MRMEPPRLRRVAEGRQALPDRGRERGEQLAAFAQSEPEHGGAPRARERAGTAELRGAGTHLQPLRARP